MPSYNYRCKECGHFIKDHVKKISEPHPTTCPECGKESLESSFEDYKPHVQYNGPHWHEASGKRGKF